MSHPHPTHNVIDSDDPIFDFDALDGISSLTLSPLPPPSEPSPDSSNGSNTPATAMTMPTDIFDLSRIPPFSVHDFAFNAAPSTPAEIVDFISRSQHTAQQHYASPSASSSTGEYVYRLGQEAATVAAGATAGEKGKKAAASRPLAIGSRSTNPSSFDAFTFANLPSPGPSSSSSTRPLSDTHPSRLSASASPSSPTSASTSSFSASAGTDFFFQFSPTSEAGVPGSVGTDLTSPSSSPSPSPSAAASSSAGSSKGKARDTAAPSLPPLSFSPTSFVHSGEGVTRWGWPAQLSPSPSPSPSPALSSPAGNGHDSSLLLPRHPHHPELGTGVETSRRFPAHPGYPATATAEADSGIGAASTSRSPKNPVPVQASSPSSSHGQPVYRCLTHARSLTSLPVHDFRRFSLPTSPSPSHPQTVLNKGKRQGLGTSARGKIPSNLARKLLFRKYGQGRDGGGGGGEFVYATEGCGLPLNSSSETFDRSIYASFSAPATPRALRSTLCLDCVNYDDVEDMVMGGEEETETETETEGPPVSFFETRLPREVKLKIFGDLVRIREMEGERLRMGLEWTALRASSKECRWTGRDAGLVELVCLSTVSKSWRDLVFDGQLWEDFDFSKFPQIPETLLLKIASTSGSFVKSLNLSGQTTLTTAALQDVMRSLIISKSNSISELIMPATQLTSINLAGCTALTKLALHDLLMHAPLLSKLNLHGLPIVTNETCSILGVFCPSIIRLNLSRCSNIDMYGVMEFLKPRQERTTPMPLKQLRLAGLKYANDRLMGAIARYAPCLEVLDLSGVRTLHNTAIEAFVSCPEDIEHDQESVLLTARQAGRESTSGTKYRRRVTQLRHLSLSHCHMLTDNACAHLAHAVPKLEFLELAGIGTELKDGGLVLLLSTTPLIKRLDLDEACDISDAVLEALTPPPTTNTENNSRPQASPPISSNPVPGFQLEVLHLSYAVQITNDALLALFRNCTRLRHIELDNTRVNGASVKEFVRLARRRQSQSASASDANADTNGQGQQTPAHDAPTPAPAPTPTPQPIPACISVVDCRHVGENAVRDLVDVSRTRLGWRGYEARFLHFLDARDNESLGLSAGAGAGAGIRGGRAGAGTENMDECDEGRVALKSFFSWQTVDSACAAREKARRNRSQSRSRREGDEEYFLASRRSSRWWSPGSRFGSGSGSSSPPVVVVGDRERERDGCVIM